MVSIWSKTKLRRAEREEGFRGGGGSEEEEEEEKGLRREKGRGCLAFWEERERRLRRRRENGVCAI